MKTKISETAAKLLNLVEDESEPPSNPLLYAKFLLDSIGRLQELDDTSRTRGWNIYRIARGVIHAGYWDRTGAVIIPQADGRLTMKYRRRRFQDLDAQGAHEIVRDLMPELFNGVPQSSGLPYFAP